MSRRLLLIFLVASAAFLLPWTGYLAATLPESFDTGAWRPAWVGFDIAMAGCFAVAAWLTAQRRRGAAPLLAATATLLCCDAWFDVLLDWSGPDRWTSVAMAALVELPIAAGLAFLARRVPNGAPARRTLTRRDFELNTDAEVLRVVRALKEHPDIPPPAADEPVLRRLAAAGYARRCRDGRWRPVPVDLHLPHPEQLPEEDRDAAREFADARNDRELRILGWAAAHGPEFGPWGQASRSTTHLTEAELAKFTEEYDELAQRYYLRRSGPAPGTREVALRFYAFPMPTESEVPVQQPAAGSRQ
jgi:hypothetical protein